MSSTYTLPVDLTHGSWVDGSHRQGRMRRRLRSWRGGGWTRPARCACLALVLGACGDEDPAPTGPSEPDTVVRSIEVIPPERTVGVLGTQFMVRAEALNQDGDILFQDLGRFSWSSSAPDVATVSLEPHPRIDGRELQLVTGMSEGTATVTATSQGVTGTMAVTVRDRAHLAWSVETGDGWNRAGVAVGTDGTIYVVSAQPGTTSRLIALSPQGNVIWTLAIPFRVIATPAIGADGTLYLGSWSPADGIGRLVAVDAGGTIRWTLEDLDGMRASPAIGADGTIYAAGRHHVYAVDPQGEIQWAYERERDGTVFFLSSPGIASDGTIYVGGEDGLLYAIDPDGSLLWTFRTGDRIRSSPSLGTDGAIYFGSYDGRLYAVNPDGTERWSVELDFRGVSSAPSVGPDGTIYVIAGDVFAVDPGGSVRWSYPVGWGRSPVTPLLGADGTVYVAGPRAITALSPEGELLWDHSTGDQRVMGSGAIGADGAVLAASTGFSDTTEGSGTIHAITETDPTNGGFEGAPWPTERGDRANTGRAGG